MPAPPSKAIPSNGQTVPRVALNPVACGVKNERTFMRLIGTVCSASRAGDSSTLGVAGMRYALAIQ
jgi:hypothetical protein